RYIKIDMLLSFKLINKKLIDALASLEPFGMGNPEPVFATEGVEVLEVRKIGKEQTHLKMKIGCNGKIFDAIAFGFANTVDVSLRDKIDIAYTVDENIWNGRTSLQ